MTLCFLISEPWSSEFASSMGRPLSLREFLLSAKGDALLSQTILCRMQDNTGGKQGILSEEKRTQSRNFQRKYGNLQKSILSPVYPYSMCNFSMRAQARNNRVIFYLSLTLLISIFLCALLFLFSSLTATLIEDPCRVKHCTKCITLLSYLLLK